MDDQREAVNEGMAALSSREKHVRQQEDELGTAAHEMHTKSAAYAVARAEQLAALRKHEDDLGAKARRGEELAATQSGERARLDAQEKDLSGREERIKALDKVLAEQKEKLEDGREELKVKARAVEAERAAHVASVERAF